MNVNLIGVKIIYYLYCVVVYLLSLLCCRLLIIFIMLSFIYYLYYVIVYLLSLLCCRLFIIFIMLSFMIWTLFRHFPVRSINFFGSPLLFFGSEIALHKMY